jgi:hypothetical protein
MDETQALLEESKLYVRGLRISLVSRTDPAQVSLIAQIPYKALQIREALLYRATDLADASCALIDTENLVSAACTTRAFQETLAALFYVNRKVKKAIDDENVSALDETLMKALMGSKNNPDMPDPINVLKMVDRVEKEIPGFRDIYDILSELSHPNWAGTLGIYTKIDTEKLWTDFGKNIRPKGNRREQIVFTLHAGLELIVHIYDEFAEFLPQLVTVCEKAIGSKAAT